MERPCVIKAILRLLCLSLSTCTSPSCQYVAMRRRSLERWLGSTQDSASRILPRSTSEVMRSKHNPSMPIVLQSSTLKLRNLVVAVRWCACRVTVRVCLNNIPTVAVSQVGDRCYGQCNAWTHIRIAACNRASCLAGNISYTASVL